MRRTRAQLLWKFQGYMDSLKIMDPERRDRWSNMFLQRQLSRATENDFKQWCRSNRAAFGLESTTPPMRTRGSRLVRFSTWLYTARPYADREERERLIRLYNGKALARGIELEFHRFIHKEFSK